MAGSKSRPKLKRTLRSIFTAEVAPNRIVVPKAEDRRFLALAGIAFATMPSSSIDEVNAAIKRKGLVLRPPLPWSETRVRIRDLILSRYPTAKFAAKTIILEALSPDELDSHTDAVRRYLSAFAFKSIVSRSEVVRVKATGKVAVTGRNSLLASGAAETVYLAEVKYAFDADHQTAAEPVAATQEIALRVGGHRIIFSRLPPVEGLKDEVLQVRMAPVLMVGENLYENDATAAADAVMSTEKRHEIIAFAQELLKRFA